MRDAMRCDAHNDVIVNDAFCLGHFCFYTKRWQQKIARKIALTTQIAGCATMDQNTVNQVRRDAER